MSEYNIGSSIKKLRLAKKLTLQAVAAETGFSTALISQIENDNVSPPIATLSKIAKFFDVKMARFFAEEEDGRKYALVRAGERPTIPRVIAKDGSSQGYFYQSLCSYKQKKMDAFMVTVTGKARDTDVYSHEGEEFVFIRSGCADFLLDERAFTLHQGDALYFDSSRGHRLLSHAGDGAEVVVVVTK
jgi:transcriptional regulator with XRE-family HTH domain